MSSESSLRMTVSVPNGETGQEILRYLAAADDDDVSFTVDCLVDGGTRPCTLSVDEITPKQWEAAALAVQKGYYEHPKETDLADLAEEMDISKSAVSQRLRTLERKLMIALIDNCEE